MNSEASGASDHGLF